MNKYKWTEQDCHLFRIYKKHIERKEENILERLKQSKSCSICYLQEKCVNELQSILIKIKENK